MNQKSATRTIDIKVPVSPGGRPTTGKPKSKTSKRSRKSRGARQSRAASAQDMRDYYYSASLVDPWGTLGSKIPDAVTTASFTTHSVIRGTFPASTLLAGSGFANGALLDIKPGVALTGNSILFPVSPGSLPDMIRFGAPSKPIPNAGGLQMPPPFELSLQDWPLHILAHCLTPKVLLSRVFFLVVQARRLTPRMTTV